MRLAGGPEAATEEEMDGPRGDPKVPFDPKGWQGEAMKGRLFSECTPEYLERLAGFFDWSADRKAESGDMKHAGYAEKDARLARGWAKRLRAGWLPPDLENDAAEPANPFGKPAQANVVAAANGADDDLDF